MFPLNLWIVILRLLGTVSVPPTPPVVVQVPRSLPSEVTVPRCGREQGAARTGVRFRVVHPFKKAARRPNTRLSVELAAPATGDTQSSHRQAGHARALNGVNSHRCARVAV